MADFRIKYGMAYGGIGSGLTLDTRGVQVAPENQAKPDVTNVSLLYTSNSTATAITDFNLQTTTRQADYEGKYLRLVLLDTMTRLVNAGNLRLSGTDGLQGANSTIDLIYQNSGWTELGRSRGGNDYVTVGSVAVGFNRGVIYAAQSSIDVRGISFLSVFAAAGSPTAIQMLNNGEAGQRVVLYAANSEFPLIGVNSSGYSSAGGSSAGFLVTSTGGSRLNIASNATAAFRYTGQFWVEER